MKIVRTPYFDKNIKSNNISYFRLIIWRLIQMLDHSFFVRKFSTSLYVFKMLFSPHLKICGQTKETIYGIENWYISKSIENEFWGRMFTIFSWEIRKVRIIIFLESNQLILFVGSWNYAGRELRKNIKDSIVYFLWKILLHKTYA